MGAAILNTPELVLSETEATNITTAFQNVARHYDTPVLSEKTLDWVNLIMVVGTVYGTRLVARNLRRKSERAESRKSSPLPFVAPSSAAPGSAHKDKPKQTVNGKSQSENIIETAVNFHGTVAPIDSELN